MTKRKQLTAEELPDVFGTDIAAEYLGVDERTVCNLVRCGTLPALNTSPSGRGLLKFGKARVIDAVGSRLGVNVSLKRDEKGMWSAAFDECTAYGATPAEAFERFGMVWRGELEPGVVPGQQRH